MTPLVVCRFLLPCDNPVTRNFVQSSLLAFASGFTCWPVLGGWLNPEGGREVESLVAWEVSVPEDLVEDLQLLALRLARKAGERALYWVRGGEAWVLDVPPGASTDDVADREGIRDGATPGGAAISGAV